jgi:GT2 family glycosyltransferase
MRESIIALLTCHNRRVMTLRCLTSLFSQELPPHLSVGAVLIDDGSTDATGDAVLELFGNDVELVRSEGNLFWAGGMALAEVHAVRKDPDYLLWLNDDVELASSALSILLQTSWSVGDFGAIAVGAVADPDTGRISYSGHRRVDRHPLRFKRVTPADTPVEVETFNGNVVLVPRVIFQSVGGIDASFRHAAADFDYALRARALGFRAVLAPAIVGVCPSNNASGSWRDRSLPPRDRFRHLVSVKGTPPTAYARYLRRHGGRGWPVWWLATYVKFGLDVLYVRIRRGLVQP